MENTNNINIIADYHTHTTYSHGKGTVRDNVLRARELGLKSIAITDHGAHHYVFGVSDKNLGKQIEEIKLLREEYKDINILSGIEANLKGMSGKIDISGELLRSLDILLCGFHQPIWGEKFSDYYKLHLGAYTHALIKPTRGQIARNTAAYLALIKNNPIDILTHPNFHLKLNIQEIAKACEDYGTVFELSSRHDNLTPSEYEILAVSNCYIAINSDAHKVENIGKCDFAKEILAEYDIPLSRVVNCEECHGFTFRSKR